MQLGLVVCAESYSEERRLTDETGRRRSAAELDELGDAAVTIAARIREECRE